MLASCVQTEPVNPMATVAKEEAPVELEWVADEGCGEFPAALSWHPLATVDLQNDNILSLVSEMGQPDDVGLLDTDDQNPYANWVLVDDSGTSRAQVVEYPDNTIWVASIEWPSNEDGSATDQTCGWYVENPAPGAAAP